jgi:hypothetical protein
MYDRGSIPDRCIEGNFFSSPQRWATGWTIGVLGFDSRRGLRIFLFIVASRTALGSTQPPIQWVPETLFPGVKRPVRAADHSLPSSAEVKNECSNGCLHGVVLGYAQGQIYHSTLYSVCS